MKVRKKGYWGLFFLTVLFALCALITIMPSDRVNEVCMFGYKANCSFTPISTLICAAFAGITCFIRKRFFVSYK